MTDDSTPADPEAGAGQDNDPEAPTLEQLTAERDEWRDKAMRAAAAAHPVEAVGERLRAMMPWIAENRLVDKTRN